MKIAVTYEDGQIFQHFGHTEHFKVYEVEDGKILSAGVVDTNGSGHGALAGFLNGVGAKALICGELYAGVSGDADAAVRALLEGRLAYSSEANCDHHGHEHHGDCGSHGHTCGGHCGG